MNTCGLRSELNNELNLDAKVILLLYISSFRHSNIITEIDCQNFCKLTLVSKFLVCVCVMSALWHFVTKYFNLL